jgi:hypothetical protein
MKSRDVQACECCDSRMLFDVKVHSRGHRTSRRRVGDVKTDP